MKDHIVTSFGEELAGLNAEIAEMGALADGLIADALDALANRDAEKAEAVVRADKRINILDADAERKVFRLLALRQPMAADLRTIVCALKAGVFLERIGDMAKGVARRTREISRESPPPPPILLQIAEMGALVRTNFNRVMSAYADRNADAAVAAWKADDAIDECYLQVCRSLMNALQSDSAAAPTAVPLFFVAKNLERIGDHSTNIAETVFFLARGIPLSE